MTTAVQRCALVLGALGATLGAACGGAAPQPTPDLLEPAVAADPGQVVATVNGRPILRQELVAQLRSGDSPRRALAALLQEELLAQEARRRGLHRLATVRDAARRALAQRIVHLELDTFTAQTVPRELVERAYEMNRARYQRPELAEVVHIVAEARRRDPPEAHRLARELADQARKIATSGRLSAEEFTQIATLLRKRAGGIKVHAESLATARRGQTVESFAEAAFGLRRPGEVSAVVTTRYGYHVLYLKGRLPPVEIPLAQAEPEIRRRIFEDARRLAFAQFVQRLERQVSPRVDETALARTISARREQ